SWNFPWPLFLIAVLVVVWVLGRERNQRPTGPAGPGAQGPPAGMESTGYVAPPTAPGAAGPPPPWEPAGAYEYQQPYQPPYQPPKRTKTGPKLFGFTLAAVLLGLGVLGLVDASGVHVVDAAYPAVALAITGAMLVVGAFYGRPGGLIALGIVSSLALGATSAADSIDGNTDQRSYHPRSAAAVQSTYHVQSGRVVLDLSDVRDPQQLDGRTIDVSAKVGELVVTLPPGVESDVTASIDGPGGIDLPDNSTGGIDSSRSGVYGAGPDTVTINADLRAGHIEVRNP
ncbi:MAG: hypothetical protein HOQ45_13270, partial [Nocardioidaceae bacterium]|nr:hypothetical protein [Nocardioidaceae bacterium]